MKDTQNKRKLQKNTLVAKFIFKTNTGACLGDLGDLGDLDDLGDMGDLKIYCTDQQQVK